MICRLISFVDMSVKRITPDQAAKLLDEGWKYVDVRSIPEFEEGHPQGAYNVPLQHRSPQGSMAPNPDFVAVMSAAFPKDERLVLGCRSGARSLRAATQLLAQGFTNIVDMQGGFLGERGAAGAVACEGWQARGLPIAQEAEPGRSYEDLKAKV